MLEELRIRGLGVIHDATLPLGEGLTVVTGETGAGKTMVVTGLLLLFGGRADSAQVRTGTDSASVDGRLGLPAGSPAAQRVAEAGGELDDDGTLVLRRSVNANGRSRAHVGGAAAPVAVLSALADRLVAVHGQSDQQRLTRPSEQRAALDRYAGVELAEYAEAFTQWRQATARLADRTSRAREMQREADLLVYGIAEIEDADPQPGEDTELAALATRLAHADALRLAARTAHDALLGDADDPATDAADVSNLIGAAARALGQQAGDDAELDALAARLTDLSAVLTDLGAELASYGERLDADPQRLAQAEERRAVLSGLTRKYGDDLEAVLEWADAARKQLAELDVSDEALAALAAERDAAAARAATLAAGISAQRTEAAARLSKAVTGELAGLAMPNAEVTVEVRRRAPSAGSPTLRIDAAEAGASADGVDDVEMLLRSHPDAPALPVQRGASGGELSRVMLAIEVCLAGTDPVPTMVFDEVDAGVGGRAAVEVGRRLARLARDHQVLVVTHLPQVAAYADRHIVVDKPPATSTGGVTRSDVHAVEGEQRVAELARMLAGSESDTAREHAAELLATASADAVRDIDGPKPKPARRRHVQTPD
ncbi:MAG TPA: DNA repair protein RecN [Jatrophihabitantaceae bacterium]|nr:DNA repair protein RecN [Jatrophihabitantaceae bacterium]